MSRSAFIVLGATGGIGSAIVRGLSDRGHHVVAAARRTDRIEALTAATGAEGRTLDATLRDAVRDLVDEVAGAGGLRGVVNCVGSILLKPAHRTTEAEVDEALDLNLRTAFNVVATAAPALRDAGGGSIVLFGSAASAIGLPNHEAIAAAKAGVAGLTRSAAATYGRWGVRVNCISPGLVETPLTERITSSRAARERSASMHALGDLGRPDEIARAALWLLDDATWVTGQEIGVDGGLSRVRAG